MTEASSGEAKARRSVLSKTNTREARHPPCLPSVASKLSPEGMS